MRTVLFILLALALFGGAFYFVVWKDDSKIVLNVENITTVTTSTQPTTQEAIDPNAPLIANTKDVWVQTRDPQTFKLKTEFRAAQFDPQKDGTVHVDKPQTRFYSADGKIITIDAERGSVVMASQPGQDMRTSAQTPSRGRLENVVVKYLEDFDLPPILEATIPVLDFDATSYRLTTAPTTLDGVEVPADQVPVIVKGLEYQFEGRGLTVNWNDLRGRLDLLEIAHGKRLMVRRAGSFLPESPTKPAIHREKKSKSSDVIFAQAKPDRKVEQSEPWYCVEFDESVTVMLDALEIASGDNLVAITQFKGSEPVASSNSITRFASFTPSPGTLGEGRVRAHGDLNVTNNFQTLDGPHPSPLPPVRGRGGDVIVVDRPTTAPVRPMEIHWTGKLKIVPFLEPEPGQSVQLKGNPAIVNYEGAIVEAGLLKTVANGRGVILEPINDQTPVTVRSSSAQGSTELTARRIDADSKTGLATLIGPASFTNTDAKNETTKIRWNGDGHMTEPSAGKRLLTLNDDVVLTHPMLDMKARSLAIGFDGVDEKSIGFDPKSMRTMTARGNVTVINQQADLSAGVVTINMDHRDGAQQIVSLDASENVSFAQKDAEKMRLNARTMLVEFDQSTQIKSGESPIGQIKSMRATGDVNVTAMRDNAPLEASGEIVEMTSRDAKNYLTVHGSPARLTSTDGTIQASAIDLNESDKSISVAGAGTLSVIDPDTKQSLDLSWKNSFNASQSTNQLQADGEVFVRSMFNNQQLEATANRLNGLFDGNSASRSGLKSIQLHDKVILNITAPNEPSMRLESTQMDVDVDPMRVRVPVGGRMLVERFQIDKSESNRLSNAAIVWNDSLDWDGPSGQAKILGDVKIGIARGETEPPTRVFCDRIDAQLTPLSTGDRELQNLEVLSLLASGSVRVRGEKASFDTDRLAYDATTQLAQAMSSEGRSVEVYDPSGQATLSFSGLSWNVETGLIESITDIDARYRP